MAGHARDARGRSAVNLSRVYSLKGHRAESSEPRSCIAHAEGQSVDAWGGRVRDGHLPANVPEVGTGDGQKQVQARQVRRHRRVRQSGADDENADGMRGE
jgi:hypothetical protein|tara:strand:- start:70 stop:369 length:300 start_codon:yes stop_codon:yes gene_type:complete